MAYTLYIVDDAYFAGMPKDIRDTTVAQTKKLFAFLSAFKVLLLQPSAFPVKFDFTDSVVCVVETDAAVDAYQNQSVRHQTANLEHSATEKGVPISKTLPKHNAGTPDGGGIGFQSKEVLAVGNKKVAFVLTGGAASVEFAKDSLIEILTNGRTEREILAKQRALIEGTPGRPGLGKAKYDASAQGADDRRHLAVYAWSKKPLKDWPKDQQISLATALARIIAHEARHQYVGPHYDGGGLGAGSPAIWGDKNFESFDEGDQKEIKVALEKLARKQATANVHLETNPTKQPFPF